MTTNLLRIVALIIAAGSPTFAVAQDLFETRVRPVLATECYSCHANSELGGLRLDSREAMLKGGQSGPAVVPGDPDKSLLITAIRQTGALKMPMGSKLKNEDIDAIAEWVRKGAVWPVTAAPVAPSRDRFSISPEQRAFWSYQPLRVTAPPPTSGRWAKTDIDRFILARLEKEGLQPVAAADRRTLLRRATLDLTGVPPTPEDIDAFEKDKSPDAFAKVVDRLLASPRYGERWGRLWLDVARYGEDDYRSLDPMGRGYAPYPNAYLYRDWVVKAFNDDLPYDQFVRAQLAADFLDESQRIKMLPALGFLGQGPWFYDNGAVEITRADERHDRIDVVTRGFLGLTAGCARCHDHKYDPISTKDYYALSGVFASSTYHEYPLVPKAVADEHKRLQRRLDAMEKQLGDFMRTEGTNLAESLVLQASKYMQAVWRVKGEPKEQLTRVIDELKLDYELTDRWIEFLARPPRHYPFLKDWQEMIARGGTKAEAKKLADAFQAVLLDVMFERKEVNAENEIILAKAMAGTKKREKLMKPNEFVTNDDFCPGCGAETKSMPVERANLWVDVFQRNLDDVVLPGGKARPKPGLLLFRDWGLERQLSAERRAYVVALRQEIDDVRKSEPDLYPYVHGVADRPESVDMPVSLRGSPYSLGEVVPRGFLSVLSPATDSQERLRFKNGSGRLELADAILKQPLALRVIVNRLWKWHFGTGIVNTPSNFGVTGERPVHPELLEYLADSFARNGMSIKKLNREIMLSAVYQLSTESAKSNEEKDAGNRWYWRANRSRMDAEQVRDSLLFVSGALDNKQGGPSEVLKPESTRRTLYGKVSRYKLDEYLQLFDFPSPMISAEQRFTTNVPLQRLFFMNSDFMQQQAERLAQRIDGEPDSAARIQKAYRLIFGRPATPEELQLGLDFLRREPLRQLEDRLAKESADSSSQGASVGKPMSNGDAGTQGKNNPSPTEAVAEAPRDGEDVEADGMMAGVNAARTKEGDNKPLLPVTVWGRYVKVLLSSSEFVFIN